MTESKPTAPLDAQSLIQRIQSGENVPLETLVQFILQSDKELTKERKAHNAPPKEKDVDFF
jgi:hypothetical protein